MEYYYIKKTNEISVLTESRYDVYDIFESLVEQLVIDFPDWDNIYYSKHKTFDSEQRNKTYIFYKIHYDVVSLRERAFKMRENRISFRNSRLIK